MPEALINPQIMQWACQRAAVDFDYVAYKLKVKIDTIQLWGIGEEKPTFYQAQKLAKILHIPFGYLFLHTPPPETLQIPNFRTVKDKQIDCLSLEVKDLLADLLRKQDWFRDHIKEKFGEPIAPISRFTDNSNPFDVAQDITSCLELNLETRQNARNWEDFQNILVERIERLSILVMKSGIVGTNTHRPLDVSEFRGISLVDEFAPIIFINGRDAKAAQIFTIIHELTHLWIGQSSISNSSLADFSDIQDSSSEKFCNIVAAEVLVPERLLRVQWDSSIPLHEIASRIGRFFRVSTVVIARKAYDIGLITQDLYRAYYEEQARLWNRQSRGSGGNYYKTAPIRNSKSFTAAVLQMALSNKMLLRDAGNLLGIAPANLRKLATQFNAR
jgi:Zn-dependent peptidase ImmA (M78 family)